MPTAPPKHRSPIRQTYRERRAAFEKQRATRTARGYDNRWLRARAAFLARRPLCVHCEAAGRVVAATEVDHIRPHRGDRALFWDSGNWQALCASCHSRKTARELGWGREDRK